MSCPSLPWCHRKCSLPQFNNICKSFYERLGDLVKGSNGCTLYVFQFLIVFGLTDTNFVRVFCLARFCMTLLLLADWLTFVMAFRILSKLRTQAYSQWPYSQQSTLRTMSGPKYRVTHQVVTNLPLTSKQKFPFGLVCPGQNRILYRCQREVRHNLMCHPVVKFE